MNTYYYWDNEKDHHAGGFIFSCKANLITEANVLFKAKTGLNVGKAHHISATFEGLCSTN